MIEQCDLEWTVGQVVIVTLLLICVGAALGNWWIAPGLLGWLPGLALGSVPYLYLLQKRKRRSRRFAELLPEAIDSDVARPARWPGIAGNNRNHREGM